MESASPHWNPYRHSATGCSCFCFSVFLAEEAAPSRLADVNLQEGETLTYRVKQDIEIQGGDTHKGVFIFKRFYIYVFSKLRNTVF